jgi:hypothetical protein
MPAKGDSSRKRKSRSGGSSSAIPSQIKRPRKTSIAFAPLERVPTLAHKPCHFLALPAELRDRIYGELMTCPDSYNAIEHAYRCRISSACRQGLAYTCRQIHEEVFNDMYRRITCEVFYSSDNLLRVLNPLHALRSGSTAQLLLFRDRLQHDLRNFHNIKMIVHRDEHEEYRCDLGYVIPHLSGLLAMIGTVSHPCNITVDISYMLWIRNVLLVKREVIAGLERLLKKYSNFKVEPDMPDIIQNLPHDTERYHGMHVRDERELLMWRPLFEKHRHRFCGRNVAYIVQMQRDDKRIFWANCGF